MSYNNGIITTPVDASDPYNVLGVGRYDGLFNIPYICSNLHGKINKWSKYKPIRFDYPHELTLDQIKFKNYGLRDPDVSVDIETASKKEYEYQPPNIYTDWKRLLDFENYNHYASPPCIGVGDYVVDLFFQETQTFQFMYGGFDGISLKEFRGLLQDYYICFAIKSYRNGVAYYDYKTSSETIGNGGGGDITFHLKLDPPFSYLTDYSDSTYYWVAAKKPKNNSSDQEPSMQNFLPLPFFTNTESTGKIKYIEVSGDSWAPTQVSTVYSNPYVKNLDFFIGLPTEDSLYFKLNSNGDIYYTFEVENEGVTDSTYTIARFRCQAIPTWANGAPTGSVTGLYIPNFYTMNENTGVWSKFSGDTIKIPSKSKTLIRLGVPGLLRFYDGNSYPMRVGRGGLSFDVEYNEKSFTGTPFINVELK